MKRIPNIVIYVIAALLVGTVLALSREPKTQIKPPDAAALTRAADLIGAVPDIAGMLATCPADVWQTRISMAGGSLWNETSCLRDFEGCVDDCVGGQSASACRYAARAIEVSDDPYAMDPAIDLSRRQAYALACALGGASACTNRAAALRNASHLTADPLLDLAPASRDLCLYRSFASACEAGSRWGCAMSGQSLYLGEGVARDDDAARAQLRRACAETAGIEPQDAARAPCRYAEHLLSAIDAD